MPRSWAQPCREGGPGGHSPLGLLGPEASQLSLLRFPDLQQARLSPGLTVPCPRPAGPRGGRGLLAPWPQMEPEVSLAAGTDGPVTRRPHGAPHLCLHAGCDKSRQTSCRPRRLRGVAPEREGAPGTVAPLQEGPGGEAEREEESRPYSRSAFDSQGNAVRWEERGS